ncbi:bifunctional enoyl-CoA hydratase/phosphate acetyltransferase [Clostridium sp. SYSU_GA19001]|uniref:bifunctional enoyl-CoA hydratase/phosphate acetyltransferase n=1 Tax=Clostridium caldaquaticum TaxID=2940653 RepID=UPI00207786E4|nr:bifunctional enoyl-CoA hydratase/phosphate acetyltransferase [Clostridium caldaquaticum]MCM8711912.1 bifunctional enoyl-CoA hydratase/phosphate acetyltransferase [Clostridium caldaquaticum]
MEFRSFDELIKKVQNNEKKKKVAVVSAQDEHTLEAVFRAVKDNIVEPVLIGDKDKIKKVLQSLNVKLEESNIIDVENDAVAAETAVKLINDNKADFIMKGKIQTADLLRAVVNKEKGLRTGRVMSILALHEVPGYHKLLAITDGGMMMYPNLEEKKQIIENAVNTLVDMGYENPKVAVLAAVENVNPKMPETVDADALKKMNLSGEIKNCIVEGPISYDLTMSKESAEIKGYSSPVCQDADILIAPNITTGNILSKALIYSAGAKMAGFVVGAKVPIVITSRGATAEEKYLSLVLSASAVK